MRVSPRQEIPDELREEVDRARKFEWITLGYMTSVVILMYLVLGSSQAMKTAWIEDLLALIPPTVFLIASRFRHRPPTRLFPYGYHRAISTGYLISAAALMSMGLFLVYDGSMKLILQERPTIAHMEVLGTLVWQGWLMIAVLVYAGVGPAILGRLKMQPARRLHDKVLYTDAQMNAADWMTALAAAIGVLGIGLGLWWADAVAALFISFSVLKDGWKTLSGAVRDLMDEQPTTLDEADRSRSITELEDRLDG